MKAVQLVAPETLVLADVASRALRDDEVRIRVRGTCVCGSDLKNARRPVQIPQIPGHEFSGTVIETASKSSKLRPGDAVTAFPMKSCLECAECRKGNHRDCATKQSLGFQLPGSFAEEVIVGEAFVVPLVEGLSLEDGALVEHLACGYRVTKEIEAAGIPYDAHVVILGDGPIAFADLQFLRASGYANVTLVGKHAARMAYAERLGAARVISDASALSGIDVYIQAAAVTHILERSLDRLNPGAFLVPQTRIEGEALLTALAQRGARMGRGFAYHLDDFDAVMRAIASHAITTEGLITRTLSLSELPAAMLDPAQRGRDLKIYVQP